MKVQERMMQSAVLFVLLAVCLTAKFGDGTSEIRANRVKRQALGYNVYTGQVNGVAYPNTGSLYGTGLYGNAYSNGLYGTGSGLYGNAYSSGLYGNTGYSSYGDPNLYGTVGVGPGQVGVNGYNTGYYTGTNVGYNNYG